jgi:hypothetical protein
MGSPHRVSGEPFVVILSPFAVMLSAAKDLALGFCVKGPNQGEMLRYAQHDIAAPV